MKQFATVIELPCNNYYIHYYLRSTISAHDTLQRAKKTGPFPRGLKYKNLDNSL